MDMEDAIMLSIIGGHHRFEKILSASYKMCKMTRASFDKYLKQLVQDKYIIRKYDGKIIEYHVNNSKKDEILQFQSDDELDRLISENNDALDSKMKFAVFDTDPEYYEETLQMLHDRINRSLNAQRQRTILLNLVDMPKSLQNKHNKELEKLNTNIRQTLQIIDKINPEIRLNYEKFLLKRVSEEVLYDIKQESKFKGDKLLDKILKKYRKSTYASKTKKKL